MMRKLLLLAVLGLALSAVPAWAGSHAYRPTLVAIDAAKAYFHAPVGTAYCERGACDVMVFWPGRRTRYCDMRVRVVSHRHLWRVTRRDPGRCYREVLP